ncbi:hypothetical protein [Streptomyces sp. NPDC003077]|uniref:hypothetical protein n=1 Tax=Streptomyces sp. NPDC003077 TaxID=3154443 RepID=UPI00339E8079
MKSGIASATAALKAGLCQMSAGRRKRTVLLTGSGRKRTAPFRALAAAGAEPDAVEWVEPDAEWAAPFLVFGAACAGPVVSRCAPGALRGAPAAARVAPVGVSAAGRGCALGTSYVAASPVRVIAAPVAADFSPRPAFLAGPACFPMLKH